MLRYFTIIAFVTLCNGLFAQDPDYVVRPPRDYDKDPAKNALFIELGGNAGLYSLNGDRIYFYRETFKMSVRAGLALMPNGRQVEQSYLLEHCFIFFKNPHHLELGLGPTLMRRYNERPNQPDNYFWENLWFGVWRCGYRYQKQDEGFFFRAALTPAFMSHDALGAHPDYFQWSGGISLGLSF